MALQNIIDLDEVLHKYAARRLGPDVLVEKMDTSGVEVRQQPTIYKSNQDWWSTTTLQEEYYDNDGGQPVVYQLQKSHTSKTSASWSIIKAFRSAKLLPFKVRLEYPVSTSAESQPPSVVFDLTCLDQQVRQVHDGSSVWNVSESVSVYPYSSTLCKTRLRMCILHNVTFNTDIVLSGTLRMVGRKSSKKGKKVELSVSIVDVLEELGSGLGFSTIDNSSEPSGPARQSRFRLEGVCSGEVGVEAFTTQENITSLV